MKAVLSRFVLDNTVTMAWCFTDEATDFTETLLNRLSELTDTALVPALWHYDVVNIVELAVRKGRITKEGVRFSESGGVAGFKEVEALGRKEGVADAYANLGIVYQIRGDLVQPRRCTRRRWTSTRRSDARRGWPTLTPT